MRAFHWISLALLFVAIGCAPAAEGAGGSTAPRMNRNVITAEEIAATERAGSAYEIVQALRPNWLRTRAGGTVTNPGAGEPVVYVDGIRMGGTNMLRQIERSGIVTLQYLDAKDATTRFGTGHSGGVIMVGTRRGTG
jgi:hypothetical protein